MRCSPWAVLGVVLAMTGVISPLIAAVMMPATPIAASITNVPRSLASAAGPVIGAGLFAAGFLAAPLVVCGALKIAYDLAIWRSFKHTEGLETSRQ